MNIFCLLFRHKPLVLKNTLGYLSADNCTLIRIHCCERCKTLYYEGLTVEETESMDKTTRVPVRPVPPED